MREYLGRYQGYNVQAAATREQIVVAAELTRQATDVHELPPMVEAANRNLQTIGQTPVGVLLADAGYYSDANVRALAEAGAELLIAGRSDRNRRAAGPAPRGRIPTALSPRERMRRKLTTKRGRRLYEQRRWMFEPAFGEVKENRGIRRFRRRSFEACASEWKLIAATHNLRKLYRHGLKQPSSDPSGRPAPEPRLEPRRSGPIEPNPARCIAGGRRTTAPNRLLRNR